jgi:L-threonylcarbamoyladenylate synthase
MKTQNANQHLYVAAEQATATLLNGGVGVMPTDTVYGLVARAHDEKAVARLYALKHRDHKPGTLIAASVAQLRDLGVSEAHLQKAGQWWPNPLSIILPIGEAFTYLHQNVGDIAIRVVIDEQLKQILEITGPLLTSSANQPGKPGSTTITEAWSYFEDSIDFYVDGGDLSGRAPSTIIRLTDAHEVEIIRVGAVKF